MNFWNGFAKQAAKIPFTSYVKRVVPGVKPAPAGGTLDYTKLRREAMMKQTPKKAPGAPPKPAPVISAQGQQATSGITDPFTWRRALAQPAGK